MGQPTNPNQPSPPASAHRVEAVPVKTAADRLGIKRHEVWKLMAAEPRQLHPVQIGSWVFVSLASIEAYEAARDATAAAASSAA